MSGYTYVEGHGTFYGVPARDITEQEFDEMTPDQQRIVRESPAYSEAKGAVGLASLTRAELEAKAEEVGVVDADQYSNKAQLVAAIEGVGIVQDADASSEEG